MLKAGPCVIAQVKTVDTDGYEAVQLGLVDTKPTKENKPTTGHFKKAGVPPTRVRREVKVGPGGEPAKAGVPKTPVIALLQSERGPFRIAPFFDYLWPNSAELLRVGSVGSTRRLPHCSCLQDFRS